MSVLHIVEQHSDFSPEYVIGYYLEKADGSRVGETFVNCGIDAPGAMNNARLFAGASDLLAALRKAEDFIAAVADDSLHHGLPELFAEIDEAVSNAEPL